MPNDTTAIKRRARRVQRNVDIVQTTNPLVDSTSRMKRPSYQDAYRTWKDTHTIWSRSAQLRPQDQPNLAHLLLTARLPQSLADSPESKRSEHAQQYIATFRSKASKDMCQLVRDQLFEHNRTLLIWMNREREEVKGKALRTFRKDYVDYHAELRMMYKLNITDADYDELLMQCQEHETQMCNTFNQKKELYKAQAKQLRESRRRHRMFASNSSCVFLPAPCCIT